MTRNCKLKIANCKLQIETRGTKPRLCRLWCSIPNLQFAICNLQSFFLVLVLAAPVVGQDNPAPPADAAVEKAKAAEKPVEAPPPVPMELQPYRIRISVAFGEDPLLTAHTRQEVLAELATWVDRSYGAMWVAAIEENHWLAPENEEGLSRLTWASLETQLADKELDKAFLLCVSGQGSVLRVCGREWDRMTQQLSVRQERIVADRRALTAELGVVLRDLFRPLVLVESAETGTCRVRARAGEFPAADPSVEQLAKGNFFQPIMRFFNKEREVTQIQQIPWTYLLVESSERGRGECSIHTGLRSPIGKNSKRLEYWAIGVRPAFTETRIRVTPHNNPTKPLIGYQVNVYERQMVPAPPPAAEATKPAEAKEASKSESDKSDSDEEPQKPAGPQFVAQFNKVLELVTDRRGRVTVPLNPEKPLIWLYVSSGGNLLGRFPFVPGIAPSITAELPDDSLRLQIESRLELLRAELIDSVARRALLIARAKGAAKTGDWTRFNETLTELDRQPKAQYFQTLLDAVKASMLKQAQAKKDKGLEKKIDKLCGDSAQLIARHLSDEKIKEQRDELAELKRLDDESNANEGRQVVGGAKKSAPAPAKPPPQP